MAVTTAQEHRNDQRQSTFQAAAPPFPELSEREHDVLDRRDRRGP